MTVQPRRDKVVLVFAPDFRMAREWADEEHIRPTDWTWVRSAMYLRGRDGNEWASVLPSCGPSHTDIIIHRLNRYERKMPYGNYWG